MSEAGSPSPIPPAGKRTPQQARSRRTRERILAAAVGCFEARGYEATNTAAIAERAGVAVGTLYGYFSDKRSLLLEVLDHTVSEIADHVVASLDIALWRDSDPRRQVRELIEAVFHTRTISPGIQRILWQRYFTDPGFHDAVAAIEDRVRGALEQLVDGLRAEGRTRLRNGHGAAFAVHMAVEWAATRITLGEADVDSETAVDEVTDMVSRYLFA